ncbi:hypothetical protein [Bradyrhizobium sp.]
MTTFAPAPAPTSSQPEMITKFGIIGTIAVAIAGLTGVWVCLTHVAPLSVYECIPLLALWVSGIALQLFAAIKMPDDEEEEI